RPAIFNGHVLALDISGLGQALTEGTHQIGKWCGRRGVEKSNHWHSRLPLPQQRPRRCAAQSAKKFPPSHVRPWSQDEHRIGSNECVESPGLGRGRERNQRAQLACNNRAISALASSRTAASVSMASAAAPSLPSKACACSTASAARATRNAPILAAEPFKVWAMADATAGVP